MNMESSDPVVIVLSALAAAACFDEEHKDNASYPDSMMKHAEDFLNKRTKEFIMILVNEVALEAVNPSSATTIK